MVMQADSTPTPRQRSPRTDPTMRDGDSGHGNPGDLAGDRNTLDTDTDVGDTDGLTEVRPEEVFGEEELPDRQEEFAEIVREFEGDEKSLRRAEAAQHAADTPADAKLPIDDYNTLTVPQVLKRTQGLSVEQVSRLLDYETTHRNRKTLVNRLRRLAEEQS